MTERSSGGLDERRRKLLFRAWRRGVREMADQPQTPDLMTWVDFAARAASIAHVAAGWTRDSLNPRGTESKIAELSDVRRFTDDIRGRLDRMEAYVVNLQGKEKKDAERKRPQ